MDPISNAEIEWARMVRAQHPELTSYGFGTPSPYENQWRGRLSMQQLEMVVACRRWLEAVGWRSTADASCPGSYQLKHWVEKWPEHPGRSRYVQEGALLLAALGLGVPLQRYVCGWGACVGVSRLGLRRVRH
jgi:hypothetical protein